ncbi:MAG: hypothetical protein PHF99_05270 [Bacteroidales bacterium]|nr:hypothetical protein [Bacteroidales bacterium]MDD4235406.1 hypothetical protein [Bacteroidales bacterium]
MKLLNTIVLLIFFLTVKAQTNYHYDFYDNIEIKSDSSNRIFSFGIRNLNFFKNNEYFNNMVYSRALAGTILEPSMHYQINNNIKISAGLFVQKYYGETKFDKLKPLFRINWQISEDINLILGDLNNGLNHRMVEQLYQFDRHYINNDEEGVQLVINKPHFFSDIWVNYDRNSKPRDKEQEIMQLGYSGSYTLFFSAYTPLKIFVQTLWAHKGGQHLAVSFPVSTICNAVGGIDLSHGIKSTWNFQTGVTAYYAHYVELSPISLEREQTGYGYYGSLYLMSDYIIASLGYWHSHNFISMTGEPLFQSKSYIYNSVFEPNRKVFCVKLGIKKEIAKGILVGVRYENYYGIDINSYDYFYGIHLILNDEFLLKKFNN